MKIIHVVQSLAMGGQERLVLHLSRALRARGHQALVLSLTEGGDLIGEFSPIPVLTVPRKSGTDRLLPLRLLSEFSRLSPDVVHTHNPAALLYAGPAARAAGVSCLIHTKHGANNYTPRLLRYARTIARLTSAFVAVSAETASVARTSEDVPDGLLQVIENGIPLHAFGKDDEARGRVRADLGIPGGAFVIGSVGRLSREKDYPLLIRAVAPLLSPAAQLILVGDGAERGAIEATIPRDARPFVHLLGKRLDVPTLMTAFDVFSLTSITEGLPLVIAEAMATSLPIVATRVGGLPGIVDPEVGVLCPHGDEAGLRAAFIALRDDPARRAAMSARAFEHAHRRFSLGAMTDRYEALYHRRDRRAILAIRLLDVLTTTMTPAPSLAAPIAPASTSASPTPPTQPLSP